MNSLSTARCARVIGSLSLVLIPPAVSAQPALMSTGVLPGCTDATVRTLSPDGATLVGFCADLDGHTHAFRWSMDTGIVELPLPPGAMFSEANDVSDRAGVIVGSVSSSSIAYPVQACMWTAGDNPVVLGILDGTRYSYATGVSRDGSTISGTSAGGGTFGSFHAAFRWTAQGAMQSIGECRYGSRISDDASTIGGYGAGCGPLMPVSFRWANGALQDFAPGSTTQSINADGTVLGGDIIVKGGRHAFRWTAAGGAVDLFSLPGMNYSSIFDMDASGSVLVGVAAPFPGAPTTPIAWTASSGMFDVRTYLAARGVDLSGWTLDTVEGISADGSTIAGQGTYHGVVQGWTVGGLRLACTCAADFDCSGSVTSQDFFDYLGAFFTNDLRADVTHDGSVDSQDFFAFLGVFFTGCGG